MWLWVSVAVTLHCTAPSEAPGFGVPAAALVIVTESLFAWKSCIWSALTFTKGAVSGEK